MRPDRLSSPTYLVRILQTLLVCLSVGATMGQEPDSARRDFFEKNVRPILVRRCFECHGPDSDNGEAGLRLDSLSGMIQGGQSGPAIQPKQPARSLLILAISHDPSVTAMPPKTKLPQHEVAALTQWVAMGAHWPDAKLPAKPADRDGPDRGYTEEERSFWAFQPLQKPNPPALRDAVWATSPLDLFLLAKLNSKGLAPANPADRRTFLRRATIDLIGLPPTPEEVNAFIADDSSDAFAKLIDRLLASPRYGERWGRHWLDVVRYADSNGMDDNMSYVDAWRYRDYVIGAFNKDKSFDRFVREQIAGDLFSDVGRICNPSETARDGRVENPSYDWDTPHEGTIATGFLMIGPKMLAEDDPVKQQMDIVDDQIDTLGRAFMGLTLGCARCHDHKFDPIRTRDYYSLAGILKSTRAMLSYRVDSKWNSRALGDAAQERRLEELERKINYLDEAVVLGDFIGKEDEKKKLTERLTKAKLEYASIPKAMAAEEGPIEDLQVFLRGNHLTRGRLAPRGFPELLTTGYAPRIGKERSGRLELANWLAHRDHPLTARVIVNRVWQHHFGEGLVRSPNNFGRLGERPDHPELLDWLAAKLVESGWSIKDLHREIMLSSTYRMSTQVNVNAAAIDPDNRLLWRMCRRRMEAEVIRDSLLAISNRIDLSIGGPALPGNKTLVILSGAAVKDPNYYESNRRSVYLPVLRSGLYDVFQAFDFPDPAVVNGRRSSTTVAPQALFMMNGSLMEQASLEVATSLIRQHGEFGQRVSAAYQAVYSREPTQTELSDWREFLTAYEGQSEQQVWQSVCRVLLSSNEFVFVE